MVVNGISRYAVYNMDVFYKFVWYLSHLLGVIVYRISRFKNLVHQKLVCVVNPTYKRKFMTKLPSHVGVAVIEDKISYHDLSKIIIWCLTFDIPYLSIYDPDGKIKEQKERLYKQTVQLKDEIFQKESIKYKIVFCNLEREKDSTRNGHNNHGICRKIKVNLLCRENGKSDIVNAVRRYSIEKESKLKFYNYLKGNADFPEPDLILQYGLVPSVMGYLPWHIRLTEMFFSSTHHQIDLSHFINSLVRYSKCEQRFGK